MDEDTDNVAYSCNKNAFISYLETISSSSTVLNSTDVSQKSTPSLTL